MNVGVISLHNDGRQLMANSITRLSVLDLYRDADGFGTNILKFD